MTIKVEVPDNIVALLRDDYGYSKPQCENILKTFLIEVLSGWYGNFEADFNLWLGEKSEEELNQIKQGRQL
jgi:hypothetical protein